MIMGDIERYIEEFSSAGSADENALLAELDRATNLRAIHPRMVSGRVQGVLLTILTGMLRPRRVLEIGTFTGYSALSIAAGLDESAELHTVEIDDELEDIARSFFRRSRYGHKIHLHIGSALEVVPRLVGLKPKGGEMAAKPSVETDGNENSERRLKPSESFDLIYIDGDKREYPDYYRMIMGDGLSAAMVRPGSILLADNVLWYGKVAGPESSEPGDKHTAGIVEFNRLVAADPRVENVILPLRDGINLIRVK